MSYLSWHVGMKVVFVGYPEAASVFSGRKRLNRVSFLTVGEVYTILDMQVRTRYAKSRWAGPSFYVGCEDVKYGRVWHHCAGFRPVQARKSDISLFTAMLHDQRQKVPAA